MQLKTSFHRILEVYVKRKLNFFMQSLFFSSYKVNIIKKFLQFWSVIILNDMLKFRLRCNIIEYDLSAAERDIHLITVNCSC